MLQKKYFIPLFFWFVTGALYLVSYKGGFFLDFHGALENYRQQSFLEFIDRAGIPNQSLYQVTQLFLYVLISLFGHHPIPWFLLFTFLHALNGWLIFIFFKKFFHKLGYVNDVAIFFGVLLFIISPLQSEVIIWKACLHYYTALLFIFLILYWTLCYTETNSRKYLIRIGVLYLISTFTLELFYLTPVFVLAILFLLYLSGSLDKKQFLSGFKNIFLLLVAIWFLYIFIYHSVYGKWMAHHDYKLNEEAGLPVILGKTDKYFIHVYFIEYFLPGDLRQKIYHITESSFANVFTAIAIVSILFFGLRNFKKINDDNKAIIACFLLTFCSFLLVYPMWFNDMQLMKNDRYYYLASVFMFMMLSLLIFKINIKILRSAILYIYIAACVGGTLSIAWKTRLATKVYYGLMEHFKWYTSPYVVFLNLPNNFEGIGMIPAGDEECFNAHLMIFMNDTAQGKLYDVSSFNMLHKWDGVHVKVIDSLDIKVTLNQWGTWWWANSFGATNYENELYKVKFTDVGHEYILQLKQRPPGMVLLFHQDDQWRVVDMNKIGEDQW